MPLRAVRRVLLCCVVLSAGAIGPWAGGVFAQPGPDMTLTGILLGPTPVAIIEAGGYTFITKVGEPVGDAVVTAILPTKVVLKQGNATFEIPAPFASPARLRTAASPGAAPIAPAVHPQRVSVGPPPSGAPAHAAPPRVRSTVTSGTSLTVTGILEGNGRVAIVQSGGQSFVAAAGDSIGDAVVVSVLRGKVIVKRDGALIELPIGRTISPKSPS